MRQEPESRASTEVSSGPCGGGAVPELRPGLCWPQWDVGRQERRKKGNWESDQDHGLPGADCLDQRLSVSALLTLGPLHLGCGTLLGITGGGAASVGFPH